MRPTSLLACSLLALAATRAFAVPMYYTLEGTVQNVENRGTASGYAIGQAVQYVFLVDTDLDGFYTQGGVAMDQIDFGTRDVSATWSDYFYSGYVGGDAIANDGAGRDVATRGSQNFGYDYVIDGFKIGALTGSNSDGSGYDFLEALSVGSYVTEWTVGQSGIVGSNLMEDGAGSRWLVQSTLTLTGISPVNPLNPPTPVPEPATLALFGLGLVGMGVAARRRRG